MTGSRAALAGTGPRVVSVLAVLALVAAGALFATKGRQALQEAQLRDSHSAAVAAGKQLVINFTTLDYTKFGEYRHRVLDGATGGFKDEWAKQADQLAGLVADNQTVSSPQRTEAALTSGDLDSADVIVGTVVPTKNKSAPEGVTKTYRIALRLENVSGAWKVSKLEFVG